MLTGRAWTRFAAVIDGTPPPTIRVIHHTPHRTHKRESAARRWACRSWHGRPRRSKHGSECGRVRMPRDRWRKRAHTQLLWFVCACGELGGVHCWRRRVGLLCKYKQIKATITTRRRSRGGPLWTCGGVCFSYINQSVPCCFTDRFRTHAPLVCVRVV